MARSETGAVVEVEGPEGPAEEGEAASSGGAAAAMTMTRAPTHHPMHGAAGVGGAIARCGCLDSCS